MFFLKTATATATNTTVVSMADKPKRVVPSRGCCYYCVSSPSPLPADDVGGGGGGGSELSENHSSTRRRQRQRRKRQSQKPQEGTTIPPLPMIGQSLALIYFQPTSWSKKKKIVLCRHASTISMMMTTTTLPGIDLSSIQTTTAANDRNSTLDGPFDLVYDDSIQLVPKVSSTKDSAISTSSGKSLDDGDKISKDEFSTLIQQQIGIGDKVWPILYTETDNFNNDDDDGDQTTDGRSFHVKRIGHEIPLERDNDSSSGGGSVISPSFSSTATTDSFMIPIVTTGKEEATNDVVIEPLQSLILNKVVEGSDFETTDDSIQDEKKSEDDPLLRSYWKRQMVGIVIASSTSSSSSSSPSTNWTTRITLSSSREKFDTTNLVDTGTVSFDVESFSVRTTYPSPGLSPRYHSPAKSKKNILKFYFILPSTIITISSSTISTTLQSSKKMNLVPSPSPNLPESSQQTPPPPSDTARRLLETVKCLALQRTTMQDVHVTTATMKHFPTYPRTPDIPRSFLLSGPPGCGKTYSVKWVVDESNRILNPNSAKRKINESVILCSIRGSELLQQNDNTSPAQALKSLFETTVVKIQAATIKHHHLQEVHKDAGSPVGLIFLDECDALVSVDSMAAMLADLLDRVSSGENYWRQVIVVGATNLIDSIPSFLRRAGRFDCEMPMSPPSAETRASLLRSLLATLTPESCSIDNDTTNDTLEKSLSVTDEELKRIADSCVGYVPADLTSLVRKAWLLSLQRGSSGDSNGRGISSANGITYRDLEMARHDIAPSALRGALLSAPPKISWDDIAGDPGGAKTALRQSIEWPRTRPTEYKLLGLQPPRGILLHGPPGCGKTTLARAAAGATGVAFLTLSPAQVYASSYVGEAESIIRRAFALARSASPCILFFDEIDSLFGGSGDSDGGGGGGGSTGRGRSAEARVLSTFLNEMDGVDIAKKDGVLVLGGTNRPWTLDSALLRPGRLGDKIIYLPPPDDLARRALFEKHFLSALGTKKIENWDWDKLITISSAMTGAEIVGACLQTKTRWIKHSLLHTQGTDGIESCNNAKNNMVEDNTASSSGIVLSRSSSFDVESILLEELENIKPMLSNPDVMDEFRLFQRQ